MLTKLNLNNFNLYIGNIMKCVKHEKNKDFTIIRNETYKKDVLLIGLCNNRYMTLEDYVDKKQIFLKQYSEKCGDIYVDYKSLKKVDKEEFAGKAYVLKRDK